MARIYDHSMTICGKHLVNKLGGYKLDYMTGPDIFHDVYEYIYLVTDDDNIYEITRGGSIAGLGSHLILINCRTDESTALAMSVFEKTVKIGYPFAYDELSFPWSPSTGVGQTPVVKEIFGVIEYYYPRGDLEGLKECDLYDRKNKLYMERFKK